VKKSGDSGLGNMSGSQFAVVLANNAHIADDLPNTYPLGYSIFWLQNSKNGFPITTNYGFVVTFNFGNMAYQEVVEMYTGTDQNAKQRRWFRTKRDSNNFWQPFQEIWSDGRMGAGSGLDADKVDGKNFSDIQADAQAKANTAESNAKAYTDQKLAVQSTQSNDLEIMYWMGAM